MKIKINTRLESAPGAEGRTLIVKRRTRDFVRLQQATGWKMAELQEQLRQADAYAVPVAAFFALSNAGFDPDWDELVDAELDSFESIEEPGDSREAETPADPQQLPADSSPAGDAPAPDQA
ncbi:hypothetical protein JNB63_02145 [Microbacterium trichothecenolyticum]|uniref:hypothetical protein n=1 Tax=Microbacterium trichothecenolyticum TaxID=69370 RepID=UPI001C6F35ED|nr:hypothetical protein [Microbacterium trichothecenolyticum]MBW9118887.1 hypothetical protein [Microbacterium trichothecenolyticum]